MSRGLDLTQVTYTACGCLPQKIQHQVRVPLTSHVEEPSLPPPQQRAPAPTADRVPPKKRKRPAMDEALPPALPKMGASGVAALTDTTYDLPGPKRLPVAHLQRDRSYVLPFRSVSSSTDEGDEVREDVAGRTQAVGSGPAGEEDGGRRRRRGAEASKAGPAEPPVSSSLVHPQWSAVLPRLGSAPGHPDHSLAGLSVTGAPDSPPPSMLFNSLSTLLGRLGSVNQAGSQDSLERGSSEDSATDLVLDPATDYGASSNGKAGDGERERGVEEQAGGKVVLTV